MYLGKLQLQVLEEGPRFSMEPLEDLEQVMTTLCAANVVR
jgi:hypothetical protein